MIIKTRFEDFMMIIQTRYSVFNIRLNVQSVLQQCLSSEVAIPALTARSTAGVDMTA